jgi:hypothetical protein
MGCYRTLRAGKKDPEGSCNSPLRYEGKNSKNERPM